MEKFKKIWFLLLLVVLFLGSSALAEEISSGKYPEYAGYCASVPKFFPGKRYSGR